MPNPAYQILGMFDLLSAIALILMHFDILSWRLGFVMALYLFIKAYLFMGDIASIIDGVCGVWMLLVMLGVTFGFTYVVALYLVQKAVISLL